MAGQEDKDKEKRQLETAQVTAAVERISQTEDGVTFFKWLKTQCYFDRSTIAGNPQTYEVNTMGSIAQEFQRQLYLKIRRAFNRSAKIKIEIE